MYPTLFCPRFECSYRSISFVNSSRHHYTFDVELCDQSQDNIAIRNRPLMQNVEVSSKILPHLIDIFTVFEVLSYCKHTLIHTPYHIANENSTFSAFQQAISHIDRITPIDILIFIKTCVSSDKLFILYHN